MQEAVEQTANLRAGGASVESKTGEPAVQSEAALAKQNEASVREVSAMMGGLGT